MLRPSLSVERVTSWQQAPRKLSPRVSIGATLCYNKQDGICEFWDTPFLQIDMLEPQKNTGNDDSTLRIFNVTIAKNSEVSVQSLCSANLHTDWIHSVSWLGVLGAQELALAVQWRNHLLSAQVSMAAGALVASGSDDNSISLYASWTKIGNVLQVIHRDPQVPVIPSVFVGSGRNMRDLVCSWILWKGLWVCIDLAATTWNWAISVYCCDTD